MPSKIPAQRVALTDPKTGLADVSWYKFFFDVFTLLGSGSNSTSLLDVQMGPPPQPSTATATNDNYSFQAGQTVEQAIASATWTQLLFDTEEFDDGALYDDTTSTFTAQVAGDYEVYGSVLYPDNGTDFAQTYLELRKNGTAVAQWGAVPASVLGDLSMGRSCIVRAAQGDEFDVWAYTATVVTIGATVPVFASDAGSGGYVPFASSTLGGYNMYKAFDVVIAATFWHSNTGATCPAWVGVNSPSAEQYVAATIVNRGDLSGGADSYEIQGSTDSTNGIDGTWTTLFADTSAGVWAAGESRTVVFTTVGSFSWHRFYVVASYGGTGVNCADFRLIPSSGFVTNPDPATTQFGATLIRWAA